jgi:glycosyltransferase involved in cell wall biosynthesis
LSEQTICFFNSNKTWGGGEKWHLETAQWISAKGYKAIIFAHKHSELFHQSVQSGFEAHAIDISNLSFLNLFKLLQLKNKIVAIAPVAAIVNLPSDLKTIGTALKWAGVKTIVYRRGTALPIKGSLMNTYLLKNVATHIVANSNDICQKIYQNHGYLKNTHKVKVVYNGLLPGAISPRAIEHGKKKMVVGNVGRLVEQKAQHHLIDLAGLLLKEGLDFEIQIIGDGNLKNILEKKTKQMGLGPFVSFLGQQENLGTIYNKMDIFVLTSLHEGTANAVVEAMAKGLPIIAFNVSSMPEMVFNGENGFLVPLGDIQAMKEKLIYLANNPDARNEMGKKSIEIVKRLFNRDQNLESLLNHIKIKGTCPGTNGQIEDNNSPKSGLMPKPDAAICFFNSHKAWGGGEKWHLENCLELTRKGYKTVIFAGPGSELAQRARKNGATCIEWKVSNLSFLRHKNIKKLGRRFSELHVQTIIINLSADLKLAGLAAKKAGVPHIVYRRGSAIPIKNRWLNRLLFKSIVTKVLANSEKTKDTILSNNKTLFPSDKIKVIYNGIKLSDYPFQEPRKNHEKLVLGNLGRLVYQKGQSYLVDLAVALKASGIPFIILLAGDGPLYAQLKKEAIQNGVEKEIEFIGFVSDVNGFMKQIDIFVLTSHWEGFGYVMVEAMACGKPVLAFDISSNPEIVKNGVSGYITPYADINAMLEKILELNNNRQVMHQMGIAARKHVEDKFDADKQILQLERFLTGQ